MKYEYRTSPEDKTGYSNLANNMRIASLSCSVLWFLCQIQPSFIVFTFKTPTWQWQLTDVMDKASKHRIVSGEMSEILFQIQVLGGLYGDINRFVIFISSSQLIAVSQTSQSDCMYNCQPDSALVPLYRCVAVQK